MITMRKDKQFLAIMKSTKANPTEKCIGIFDFEKKDWAENAVFVRKEMSGQKYNNPLRFLVDLTMSDKYWGIERNRGIEWVEFLLSINKVTPDKMSADFFCNSKQFRNFLRNEEWIKEAKKYLSKNMTELTTFNEVYTCSNPLALNMKNLYKNEWIEELYGYYCMCNNAVGQNYYDEMNEWKKDYYSNIENLFFSYNFSEKEITTYYRILYFQGLSMFVNRHTIIDYLKALKEMEMEIPTGNFALNYRTVMTAYNDLKEKQTIERFVTNQNAIDLHYTHENFSIFVPQNRKDLKHYGNIFHNCLNGYEWDNYLKNGERKVVIVLKDGNPVICCDMDNALNIRQFLREHNSSNLTDELKAFKTLYQNHLNTIRSH